jgi:hypothetical protein
MPLSDLQISLTEAVPMQKDEPIYGILLKLTLNVDASQITQSHTLNIFASDY